MLLTRLFGPGQDFSKYVFQPFREGVEIHRLYGDGGQGASAALLRYAPGARVPDHEHSGFEHIIVLAGAQSDANGRYAAGSCIIHGAGSRHAVTSEEGCVVLAIWGSPISFV
jgi:anti-sigma factor ChrR (cupin superfamily)